MVTNSCDQNSLSVTELRKKVRSLYPELTKVSTYKKAELCSLLSLNCKRLGGFIWNDNSCYFNSTLIALLHGDNGYLHNNILDSKVEHNNKKLTEIVKEIQKRLVSIKESVFEGHRGYSNSLRILFDQFQTEYTKIVPKFEKLNWLTEQLEPSDVIKALFNMFRVKDACKYQFVSIGINKESKDIITDEVRDTNIADLIIDPMMIYEQDEFDLSKIVPKSEVKSVFKDKETRWKADNGKIYTKNIIRKKYLEAPAFIIEIVRNFGGEKITTKVEPPLLIKMKNNKRPLYLKSIIVHHGKDADGGHYTCFLYCQGHWYHYNDLGFKRMELIGDTKELFEYKRGFVLKNMTNLFYF
jgi:uncharacterized UBP type Zn finger protein